MDHPRPLGIIGPTAPALFKHSNLTRHRAYPVFVCLGATPNMTTIYGMVLGK
jgi:hypothetical protein